MDIYVASCVETGGIYHYKLIDKTLQQVDFTPMDRPMYMVIEGRKMYIVLRAPFENGESGVIVYDIDDTGKLINPTPVQSTKGEVACHILVKQGEVYCANYISGSVIKLPGNVVQHTGHSVHPTRQTGPHVHFVGVTPDEKYICVTDLGMDTIFLYNRDMTLHASVKVPEGHGVRHLAFSDDGKWLFAVNELASTVSVFGYQDGILTIQDTYSVLPTDFTGNNTASAIRIKDGDVYVSNRGHDSIAKVSFADGKLKQGALFPCGGKSPRDFCFAGDFLLSTNQDSDTVTVLDCKNNFALANEISVDQPICVCVDSEKELEIKHYQGEGYAPQIDYNGWRVAIANYAPHLEIDQLHYLERHLETDEVFILLEGTAGLLLGHDRRKVVMKKGKLYNVKCGVWHRLFMEKGAKVVIVENTDTGKHNTEFFQF